VLAAAYRWGFIGTLGTTGITIAIFLVDTALAGGLPLNAAAAGQSASTLGDANNTFVTVASLLLAGFLLGYLAEQDKRSRAELATLADLTRKPRVRLGLSGSVVAVSRSLSRTFNARGVCFVLQDYDTRETWLWRFDHTAFDTLNTAAPIHLDAGQQDTWFFPDAGRVWHAARQGDDLELKARVVQPQAWPLRRERVHLPEAIARAGSYRTLAVANFGLADEWRGRVYLFDPHGHGGVEQSLHFLDGLVEHLTPALTNVFLLGRLRARVTAAERGRVARELHDGAIQALIGIEMKIEALRRRGDALPADLSGDLGEIQSQLRRQVLELRELMQALRPVAMDASEQLPDVLASVVERFRRDTGVPARFVSAGGSASLVPATALEVVRIVQEALVNVRKHSQARNVLVKLTAGERGCIVIIEDDGLGFEFEGTLSGDELDRRRIGPAIIKERARIAGAHLTIESHPGSGARIELIVNAAHA
jgi:signal transduction histidine kinase